MKRFKNILVVSAEAEETHVILERAIMLAQRNETRVTVAEATAGLPSDVPTSVFGEFSEALYERYSLERN